MIRRYGEPVRPDQSYTVRPGAYAILLQGHDILLTHQANPTPEFQLPGGGIDPGEHPLPALHREVREETGWSIAAPRRLGAFRRFTYMPEYAIWAEKICTIYLARPVRALSNPTEAGHTAVWANLHDAVEMLGNDGDKAFAKAVMGQLARRV